MTGAPRSGAPHGLVAAPSERARARRSLAFVMAAPLVAAALATGAAGCGGGAKALAKPAKTELPPANPQAVTKMVQGVNAAKDPGGRDRGITLLKEAITMDGNLWEARYDLGVVLAASGDLAGAEEQLRLANKVAPDAPDVVLALAEVQRRRGEEKAAAETLGDFVAAHPQSLEAKSLYVTALRDSGQVDKAIVQARELLVRRPSDASALAELALCHLAKGEKDTASLLAKQALDSNPKSAVAERATGLIALAAGDDAAAFQAFTKATQEDPRDTTARLNMGAVLVRAGAYAKAEEQFRAVLQAAPEDDAAQVGLAVALRGQADPQHVGRYEDARGILEKVLARDPHQISALFNLGVLYADFLKKPEEAQPLFHRFLSDAPGDHPARAEAQRYLTQVQGAAPAAAKAAPPAGGAAPATPPKGGKK